MSISTRALIERPQDLAGDGENDALFSDGLGHCIGITADKFDRKVIKTYNREQALRCLIEAGDEGHLLGGDTNAL